VYYEGVEITSTEEIMTPLERVLTFFAALLPFLFALCFYLLPIE
jgi:hypothetical protein